MKILEYASKETKLFIKTTNVMFPGIPKENILIFDIDTTAFEAANGCVFLIGTLSYENSCLTVRQFFSEDISEEAAIIEKFIDHAEKASVLLSYKGDSYDIPFLGKRLYSTGNKDLYYKLQAIRSRSFDLFNEINPIKNNLNFRSSKLDYLREKVGQAVQKRVDGENISKFYVQHISAIKLRALLDISRRPENIGFISEYEPKPIFDDLSHITAEAGDRFFKDILDQNMENMEACLYLLRLSHIFIMRQGKFTADIIRHTNPEDMPVIIVSEGDFSIEIPLLSEQLNLKQFYPNFKDYYYLPAEDMAIHKSLAEFTDAAAKKKATSRTAYRKVNGTFVSIPIAFAKSVTNKASVFYKSSFEDEKYYLPLDDILHFQNDKLKEFTFYCTLDYLIDKFNIALINN